MKTVYEVINAGEPGADEKIRKWFGGIPVSDVLMRHWAEAHVYIAQPIGQFPATPVVVKPEEFYDFFEDVHDGTENDDLMAQFEAALAAAPSAPEDGLTPEQRLLKAVEAWPDDERTRQVRQILG